jgi:sulfur carrier protein
MANQLLKSLPVMVGFFYLGTCSRCTSGGSNMKIILNGREEILEGATTVAGLIALKELNPNAVIVEYNYSLVKKEDWSDMVIKENDRLEILRFVGGG